MSLESACAEVRHAAQACINCKRCTKRCEVLREADARTVGDIAQECMLAMQGFDSFGGAEGTQGLEGMRIVATSSPELVFAVRRCCLCSYCTVTCPVDIKAKEVFSALREILSVAGITGEQGFESTRVDTPWHIFSVYRAVYGIGYQELPQLGDASSSQADTLFFPGCPLVSYAPELTREIFTWLNDQGYKAVIAQDCCGSPLRSAGFGERLRAHKKRLAHDIVSAGITRIVCACPACQEELMQAEGLPDAVEFTPLPQVLAEAGVRITLQDIREKAEEDLRAFSSMPSVKSFQTLASTPLVLATIFDSCADRSGAFGKPLRSLFEDGALVERGHSQKEAWCCGAGGSTALVDPDISERRMQRVLDEVEEAAEVLISNCPTCSYSFAWHRYAKEGTRGFEGESFFHHNYLEYIFTHHFAWNTIFDQLNGMWSGEYAAWVSQNLS